MEKKVKKLKLNIEALNVIKDVDQKKIMGGIGAEASGLGPVESCAPDPISLWNCTLTEASGCRFCDVEGGIQT